MSTPSIPNFRSLTQLVDKTVVILGGTSGIGYAVAQAALEHGASVLISSSRTEKVAAAVQRLEEQHASFKGRISGKACNARDEKELERFWDGVGKFDHLVYTAGDVIHTPFFEESIASQKTQFDVFFWGALISAKYCFLKGYINPGGSITLTIGSSFRKPFKGFIMPVCVIGAVDGLTRGLAVQLAPDVRVNCVSAGYVDTDFWRTVDVGMKSAMSQGWAESALVKHVASPDEIADAYLFCMKCTNLTGATLDCEGGWLLT